MWSCESAAGGGCSASISIRICRDTSELRQRDEYASRGLLGSITLHDRHSHALLPPCSANGAPRRLKRQPRARSTVAAVFTHIGRGKRYGTPSNRQIDSIAKTRSNVPSIFFSVSGKVVFERYIFMPKHLHVFSQMSPKTTTNSVSFDTRLMSLDVHPVSASQTKVQRPAA